MPTVLNQCPTCDTRTPHHSDGVAETEKDEDGRNWQWMECAVCGTSTKVLFTEGTNEFQENLDVPDDLDADPCAS